MENTLTNDNADKISDSNPQTESCDYAASSSVSQTAGKKVKAQVSGSRQVWKQRIILYSICFVISFLFLMVCSANSFLYKFNDWCDMNWYITMGRGMDAGLVMYRDIFDHKGPILYLVFAFLCLFKNPFLATWFFEVITFSFYLYLIYRFANKNLNKTFSLLTMILVGFLTCGTKFFKSGGGAVEEYFLPLITYILMEFCDFYFKHKENKSYNFKVFTCIVIGLFIGLIFWVKFTALLVPGLLLIAWLIINLYNKQFKSAFKCIGFMFVGFAISTVPVIIYFLCTNAFADLWISYFYDNLCLYDNAKVVLTEIFIYAVSHIWLLLLLILAALALVAFLIFLLIKKRDIFVFILPVLVQLCVVLFDYYLLVLMPYTIFVFKFLFKKPSLKERSVKYSCVMLSLVALCSFGLTFLTNNNIKDLPRKQSDYIQFQVSAKMDSFGKQNSTIVSYKMDDEGYYYTTNTIPQLKYFALCHFSRENLPEMYDLYEQAITDELSDFVVTNIETFEEDKALLLSHYKVVDEFSYVQWDSPYTNKYCNVVLLISNSFEV